jgi:2-dehydro-3-deoxyphosphogalactonate aldolase
MIFAEGVPPIVAILRGLTPPEAPDVARALVDAGLRFVEIPLNSPDPINGIARAVEAIGDVALVGAGTVLSIAEVEAVAAVGGRLIVSPNMDPDVIGAARARDMVVMPGIFTATEAFAAIRAGASALKLFPAEIAGPRGLKALKAVLPRSIDVLAVGGVSVDNLAEWLTAGAGGFGIGTALYTPGRSAAEVGRQATAFVSAWERAATMR